MLILLINIQITEPTFVSYLSSVSIQKVNPELLYNNIYYLIACLFFISEILLSMLQI